MTDNDQRDSAVPRLQPGTDPGGGVPITDELPAPWRDIVDSVRRALTSQPADERQSTGS
jgi:hypothetical protein